MSQLEGLDKLSVSIMIASGRRAVDVSRIVSEGVQNVEGRWFVTLGRDKVNALPVNFSFNFEDPVLGGSDMSEIMKHALESNDRPFCNINWQKIRKKAKFRLHSLRNRKAIKLILEGLRGCVFWFEKMQNKMKKCDPRYFRSSKWEKTKMTPLMHPGNPNIPGLD